MPLPTFAININSCISNFMVSKPLRHTEVRDKSLNSVIIYATIYMNDLMNGGAYLGVRRGGQK
jgi:hypothetical protein